MSHYINRAEKYREIIQVDVMRTRTSDQNVFFKFKSQVHLLLNLLSVKFIIYWISIYINLLINYILFRLNSSFYSIEYSNTCSTGILKSNETAVLLFLITTVTLTLKYELNYLLMAVIVTLSLK